MDRHFIDEENFNFVLKLIKSNIPIQRIETTRFLENFYFTEEQLETLAPYFEQENWGQVSTFQREVLTEQFVRNHRDQLRWLSVSFHWRFDLNFLREMKDYVDWRPLCSHIKMDEVFIREFYDYIKWNFFIKFQDFDFNFFNKYKMELKPYAEDIIENEHIPPEVRMRMLDEMLERNE